MRELRSHLGHVDPRHPLHAPVPLREVVLSGLTNTPEPDPRRVTTKHEHARA